MGRPYKSVLTLSFLFTLRSLGVAQPLPTDERRPALKITVFVQDYAAVSRRTAAKAERVAADILRRAGLETEWHRPAVSGRDAANSALLGPTGLALRILPSSMSPALPVNSHVFGVAFPFTQAGFGVASILFHRVEELASRKVVSRGLVLGHLMAHEIGHLLLGRSSHSAEGIMHIPWDRSMLRRAARGELLFTPRQARQLRAAVVARVAAAQRVTGDFEERPALNPRLNPPSRVQPD